MNDNYDQPHLSIEAARSGEERSVTQQSRGSKSRSAEAGASTDFVALARLIPALVFHCVRETDGGYHLPFVSDGSKALLNIEPEPVMADPDALMHLMPNEDRASFANAREASARTLETWNWDGRIQLQQTDEIKWINLRAFPRRRADGIIEWFGVVTNITQSVVAQIELRRSRERLREFSEHMESAIEQERARISRELHDDLGASFTALKFELAVLAGEQKKGKRSVAARVHSMDALLDSAIETMRQVVSDLRPTLLDHDVVSAFRAYAKAMEERSGIRCQVSFELRDARIPPNIVLSLFRVFQEALSNVAKHAQADLARIRLWTELGSVYLEVSDNGVGIRARDTDKRGHFGLRNIRERVEYLNGEFSINGSRQSGTRLLVKVPLISARSLEDTNRIAARLIHAGHRTAAIPAVKNAGVRARGKTVAPKAAGPKKRSRR